MKILAFDTAATACSVALLNGDNTIVLHKIAPMQQTRLILPMIQEVLNQAALTLADLDAIAYGCGPGSFTGIRIASSVAQGLSFATQRPIIRISSLAAIAQAAFLKLHSTQLLIALDARMDQIYCASYRANPQGYVELVGNEALCAPEEIIVPAGQKWSLIGDVLEKYSTRMPSIYKSSVAIDTLPIAEALLELACVKFKRGEWGLANTAIPTYLR